MSKKEIMDEIIGNLNELHGHFQTLDTNFNNLAEKNLNPAIKLGVNWLINIQNKDGGFGLKKGKDSNIHLTAFALLALSKGGVHPESKVIQEALGYLRERQDKEGWWAYDIYHRSESVGVTGMVVQAFHILGMNKSDSMFSKALEFLKKRFSMNKRCWRDNVESDYGEISVNESASSAIKNYLTKKDKAILESFLDKISEIDSDNGYNWHLDKNSEATGDIENTAIGLKILGNIGLSLENDTQEKIVENAVNYVINSQLKNGGFPSKKHLHRDIKDAENDATALAISGLRAIGVKPYNKVIHHAVDFLSDNQNPEDGGWGDAPNRESDTDSTALAVIALVDAGKGAVPLADVKEGIDDTKKFILDFIEKHVNTLDDDLRSARRLNRLLEINITFLAILIPIIISLII